MAQMHIASGRARLAATVAGDGDPIVFLHAGVADRRMWQPQLDVFAGSHKVVAYDRRGFGDTRGTPEPFSHVQDLDAALRATSAMPPFLVGCSIGGGHAIDYALAHPQNPPSAGAGGAGRSVQSTTGPPATGAVAQL